MPCLLVRAACSITSDKLIIKKAIQLRFLDDRLDVEDVEDHSWSAVED